MSEHERRIRTTHAGSLPRPPSLRKLLAAGFAGRGVGECVAAAELAEASAAVKRQLGIDKVNNGEQGRESFLTYVQRRMSGFGGKSERAFMRDTITYPRFGGAFFCAVARNRFESEIVRDQ